MERREKKKAFWPFRIFPSLLSLSPSLSPSFPCELSAFLPGEPVSYRITYDD